jgi:hypothetical protein
MPKRKRKRIFIIKVMKGKEGAFHNLGVLSQVLISAGD